MTLVCVKFDKTTHHKGSALIYIKFIKVVYDNLHANEMGILVRFYKNIKFWLNI